MMSFGPAMLKAKKVTKIVKYSAALLFFAAFVYQVANSVLEWRKQKVRLCHKTDA